MTIRRLWVSRLFAAGLFIACCSACRADTLFTVSLDTSSLASANGPYYLDFQLNDGGGGPASGNNVATVTSLAGYQSLGTALPDYGLGVSGGFTDAGGTLTISDEIDPNPLVPGTGGINEYTQAFTPGATLSFHVDLTTNPDSGSPPDQFLFSLFYTDPINGPQYIPSTSPLTFSFVSVTVDSASPSVTADGSDSSLAPAGIDIGAPTVHVASPATAVPEPPTSVLAGFALASAALCLAVKRWRAGLGGGAQPG